MNYSVTQRYSAYGALFSILFIAFVIWLFFVGLAPDEKADDFETVTIVEKAPVERPAVQDPWAETRREARLNGLDTNLVIGIIKSEDLLTPHKEFEGSCRMVSERTDCIAALGKKYKELGDYLGRKPTPSDVLLAHTFGVNESVRISRLIGVDKVETLGEEILKANPNLSGFESIRAFRIWLGRSVYRKTY